jgi:hypothetical protein
MERVRLIVIELRQEPDEDPEYREWVVNEIETYLLRFNPQDFIDGMYYERLYDRMRLAHARGESVVNIKLPSLPEPNQWLEQTKLRGRLGDVYAAYQKLRARIESANASL